VKSIQPQDGEESEGLTLSRSDPHTVHVKGKPRSARPHNQKQHHHDCRWMLSHCCIQKARLCKRKLPQINQTP